MAFDGETRTEQSFEEKGSQHHRSDDSPTSLVILETLDRRFWAICNFMNAASLLSTY